MQSKTEGLDKALEAVNKRHALSVGGGEAAKVKWNLERRKNGVDIVRLTVYNPGTPRTGRAVRLNP